MLCIKHQKQLVGRRAAVPPSPVQGQFPAGLTTAQMGADYISYAYASAVALGGIIGYAKAGSIPSLGAGLLFGSVLGYGAYQLSENPNNYYLTLGTSTALGGLMGMRFLNSGKFMPPGLIAVMSLAMVARLGARAVGLTDTKMQ